MIFVVLSNFQNFRNLNLRFRNPYMKLMKFFIRKNQHAEGKSNKNDAKIDAFSSKFQSIFIHKKSTRIKPNASNITPKSMIFCLPVYSSNRFFGDRNSKKRIARIRTLARLRRSVHGFEAVAITTPPPPRLRVKGVRFEVICKRTLEVDVVFDTQNSIRRRYVH